jgi:hypothetical protein
MYLVKTAAGIFTSLPSPKTYSSAGKVPFLQQAGGLIARLPGMGNTSYGKSRAWLGADQGASNIAAAANSRGGLGDPSGLLRANRMMRLGAGHQQRLQSLGGIGLGVGAAAAGGLGLHYMMKKRKEERQRQQMQQMQQMH